MRNEFNQQANRAITANNGDINCELAGDTNVRFLALNLAGSYDSFWPTTASRAPSNCSMGQEQNWHQLVVSRIQFSTANPEILLKWRSLPVTSTAPTDSA